MKFAQSPGAGSSNALPLRCLSAPKITADIWPHPLTAEGRETHPAVVPPGATLFDLIADAFPRRVRPYQRRRAQAAKR